MLVGRAQLSPSLLQVLECDIVPRLENDAGISDKTQNASGLRRTL
jgi:hypothetical protein